MSTCDNPELRAEVLKWRSGYPDVAHLTPEALQKLQAEHAVRLVDCRSEAEHAVSTLPGAVHVRSFDIASSSTPVVFFCTVGLRSAAEARAVGIPGAGVLAYSMEGILPWVHAGGELVDAHGAATRRLHAFGAKYAAMAPASHEAVCFATRLSLFVNTLRAARRFLLLRCLREYRAFWQLVSAARQGAAWTWSVM